ncbi:MAG: hypothetical protein ACE5G3_11020 [Gammaproteobacteria bacterium]
MMTIERDWSRLSSAEPRPSSAAVSVQFARIRGVSAAAAFAGYAEVDT